MDSSIGIIFDKSKKEILLVKRRDIPIWVPPGGLIEKGEIPEIAVNREVYEETGYKTKVLKKVAVYTYPSGKRDYLFNCAIVSGKARLSSESKGVKFFDLGKLPELRHPHLLYWIPDTLKNQEKVIRRKVTGISRRMVLKQFTKHPIVVIRYLLARVGLRINT